ncbi:MAG: M18 family aminopeptidase [Pseudomonadota bacterium]
MNHKQFNEGMCEFLAAATTPFHAVAELSKRLDAGDFIRLQDADMRSLEPGGKYYITANDSSIIAFIWGSQSSPLEGMRMVGAHTDSPCLMVKPEPEMLRKGCFQLGVQIYGGALLNPWFDRDLSLAGRVSFESEAGALKTALIDYREAIASIPSLAIHLDREANKGRTVNPQTDVVPILFQQTGSKAADFRALLKERLLQEDPDCSVARVLDFELAFYDTQHPAVIGMQREFIASARLDNLLSCYVGVQALLSCDGSVSTLLVCNDHEEVGSQSAVGAQGPMLVSLLKRLAGSEQDYSRLADRSLMISTDNAHAVHPNFASKHDDNHGPLMNAGPVIKVNASQRYASNSETAGLFRILAAAEEVPVQSYVVRSDMRCGSTIGPITAGGTGIRTLDVGVPTLGMHSAREMAGVRDAYELSRVLRRFYDHKGELTAS